MMIINILRKEAERMAKSFYEYMQGFLGEESDRGDLAGDMLYMQEKSPNKTCDLNEIRTWSQMASHLHVHNACDECYRTAKLCWQDYRNTPDCA